MRFQPLHPDFGVEVLDCDPRDDSSPDAIARLREALDQHQMLLFRGGSRISPERHLEIASWFGPPCEALSGEFVSTLDNDRMSGSMRLPFHSDFTYTDFPLHIITLHPIELPPGGTTTAFASGAKTWDRLGAELQERLAPLTIRHRHFGGSAKDQPEFIARHPLRFPHPRTGRPILMITEYHARRIEEMSPEESERMLQDLFAMMYAKKHVYVHQWRLNDLLIWDNLALQHSRPEEVTVDRGARVMQRVAVGGVPHLELIERARRQQAERERNAEGAVAN